jgi:hypothetical protein
MRKSSLLCAAALALACTASAVRADEEQKPYRAELSAGSTTGLAVFTSSPTQTTFVINTSVATPLSYPSLDFALDADFTTSDTTGIRITEFTLLPGLQYNLGGPNPREDYFIFLGAGFALASVAYRSETHFTYRLRAGKRFPLTSSISYAPYASFTKTATLDGEVDIVLLAFSLFF